MAPIAEAIFFTQFIIIKVSSIYILSDFTEETCSIGTLSIGKFDCIR